MLPSIKFPIRLNARQLRTAAVVVLVLLLFAASASSFAQDAGFQLLDKVDAGFAKKAAFWDSKIRVYANRLFWMLATADFCFLCATFVLDKKEMEDMLASVMRKLMTLGFFWFVLKSSNEWIPQIINSFSQIGQVAGGATATTPDSVAVAGYDAALAAFQALNDLGVAEKIGAVVPTVLMALIVFLSFLWVAAQLLIAKIETSIAVGAGIILLGFGGSKWTTDMASKYMQYSVATGLKLMLMFLLIGMGQDLFTDIHIVGGDKFFESLLVTTGTALTYGFLATKIPAIASAMMSGSPSLTAGDMTGAVIGAGAAVAGLGAAGMAAGKAGMGAATGGAAAATGVGQALSAGIASGMDHGKSGGALAAHALGEVGKHGMGLAGAGIGDMLKGGASSFQGRVNESAGGRVATSIGASRGGSLAGVAAPAGGPASGGAGAGPAGNSSGSGVAATSSPGTSGNEGAGPAPMGDAGSTSSDAAASTTAAAGAAQAATAADAGSAASQAGPTSAAASGAQEATAKASTSATGSGSSPMPAAAPGSTGSAQTQPAGTSSGAPTAGAAGAGSQTGQRAAQAASPAVSPAASAAGESKAPSQPSASAGNGGTHAEALAGPAQPGGEASTGAPFASPEGQQGKGDASDGAVSGGDSAKGNNSSPGDRERKSLHERIQNLQGYVPDDAAHSATFHIDMKHTE